MIYKSKHSSNYTVIPNEILRNPKVSLLAKGLLSYFLSLPHDWTITKQVMYKEFVEGRTTIDKAFKELTEMGYVNSVRKVDKLGKFTGWEHVVYDKPFNGEVAVSPIAEKPTDGKPDCGESYNVLLSKEKELSKDLLSKEGRHPALIYPFSSNEFFESWQKWKDHLFTTTGRRLAGTREQLSLQRLDEVSKKDENCARKIIDQSIRRGWKELFALKEDEEKAKDSAKNGFKVNPDNWYWKGFDGQRFQIFKAFMRENGYAWDTQFSKFNPIRK